MLAPVFAWFACPGTLDSRFVIGPAMIASSSARSNASRRFFFEDGTFVNAEIVR